MNHPRPSQLLAARRLAWAVLAALLALGTVDPQEPAATAPPPRTLLERQQSTLREARRALAGGDLRSLITLVDVLRQLGRPTDVVAILDEVPSTTLDPEFRFHFDTARARALAALGQPRDALQAFARAEADCEAISSEQRKKKCSDFLTEIRARQYLDWGALDLAAPLIAALPEGSRKTLEIGLALSREDFRSAAAGCRYLLESDSLLPAQRVQADLQLIQSESRLREDADAVREFTSFLERTDLPPGVRRLAQMDLAAALLRTGAATEAADALRPVSESYASASRETRSRSAQWCSTNAHVALALRDVDDLAPERDAIALQCARDAWDRLCERWQQLPIQPGGTEFLHFGIRRNLLSGLIRLTGALETEPTAAGDRALAYWVQAESRDTLVRIEGLPELTVEAARRLAPTEGGILIFVPAPLGSAALAITSSETRIFRLASDLEIRRDCAALHATIADPSIPEETVRRHANRARAALFPDALADHVADWKRMWIVGRELLQSPPFEALPDGDSWLGTECALAYLPNLSVARWLRDRGTGSEPRTAPRLAQLFADRPARALQEVHGVRPLETTDAAWDSLAEPFDASAVDSVRGAGTTGAALRRAAARSSLLVLVGHGILDSERARPRGIALADEGLFPDQLEGLPLPPLVTLLTCDAAGNPMRGESVAPHLGGAALRAGAAAVALSDHRLWLDSALAMTSAFHTALAEDEARPLDEALRIARKGVAGRDAFSHPAHHATLQLIGWPALRPQLPAGARRASHTGLIAGLAGLGVLVIPVAIALRRRRRGARRS